MPNRAMVHHPVPLVPLPSLQPATGPSPVHTVLPAAGPKEASRPPEGVSADDRAPPTSPAAVDMEVEEVRPPRAPAPDPTDPTPAVSAMARWMDLEAQLEYAFAKHVQLVLEHRTQRARCDRLEQLDVGMEAFQDDLDALVAALSSSASSQEPSVAMGASLVGE